MRSRPAKPVPEEVRLLEVTRALTGWRASRVDALAAHASTRRYFRAHGRDGETRVLMVLGSEPTKAEEFTDGALEIRELPFLEVQRRLEAAGLPVPSVHGYDREAGVVVLDDLGDLTLEEHLARPDTLDFEDCYREAVRLVTQIQRNAEVIARGSIIEDRCFDTRVLGLEVEHFLEFGVEARLGARLDPPERRRAEDEGRELVDRIVSLPQTVVHRDFQSRNLMRHEGRLVLIDFQDALIGPYVYDLVALLRDSYVVLERRFVSRMLTHYRGLMPEAPAALETDFDLVTIQRKLKDAGRFVFLDRVKGNPSFMRFFAPSVGYALHALRSVGGFPTLEALATRTLGAEA